MSNTYKDINAIKGWGATIALQLRSEAKNVFDTKSPDLHRYDFTELKKKIEQFEEIRDRAIELGVNVYGNKL